MTEMAKFEAGHGQEAGILSRSHIGVAVQLLELPSGVFSATLARTQTVAYMGC